MLGIVQFVRGPPTITEPNPEPAPVIPIQKKRQKDTKLRSVKRIPSNPRCEMHPAGRQRKHLQDGRSHAPL